MLNKSISVVLAEDHHIVRRALKLFLEKEGQCQIVGETGDGLEAVALVQKLQPDILITDLMIPRLHGLEVLKQVRRDCPKTRVIILSMHADDHFVMDALRGGAFGYVLKEATPVELVQAVKDVSEGKRFLSPTLTAHAIAGSSQPPGQVKTDIFETLTTRERLVLQLAAEGLTTAAMAEKLFISPRTAETHRANLMRKLKLNSQTDLVRFAIRKGIILA